MEPWRRNWRRSGGGFDLVWTIEEIKRYYLFHLLLHEVGHINEPDCTLSTKRRESFAEDFALTWSRRLGELASPLEA